MPDVRARTDVGTAGSAEGGRVPVEPDLTDLDDVVALYRRYERPLLAFALRRLDDRMDAEELVQETLVRLWRAAPRFDRSKGSVDCLVFTIAARVLVDILRRRRPERRVPERETHVADHADRTDAMLTVRQGMATLTPEHREVLELAYYRGLSQREIAGTLGIALGTVKTRTWWALRHLQALLGGVPAPVAA